jgi:AsmA protein
MGRLIKLLGLVVVAVVVLVLGATVFLAMFIDPNDYKEEINAAVVDATGRQLTLDGDLELDVFPTLRIAVGPASLSNAPGFGDAPFARIDGAELQVALLPLLSQRLEIRRASLTGLELNLARDARGRNNWQDIGSTNGGNAPAAAAPASGASAPAQLDLAVTSIEISNARVSWRDAAAGNNWVLDDFTLEASNFGTSGAFPLRMGFTLSGEQVTVAVDSSMQATLALAENRYRLADLDVDVTGTGSAWPGGEGEARIRFDAFTADLNAETLSLEGLVLEMLGMTVSGTLQGSKLLSNLALAGAIDIVEFDPRDLMAALNTEIETADEDVLRRASARAEFNYDGAGMGLRNMRLALDDSTLTGRIGMAGDTLQFDLDVDAINIDRYLPPAEEAPADEGSLDEVDLPIEPLRGFKAQGSLAFASAQFMGLTFSDAEFDLRAGNGQLTLTPKASFYGGSYSGRVGIEVVGNAARLTLVQNIERFALAPFARDFLESDLLSGTGNLRLNVAATGSNMGDIRRALAGDVSFSFTDGAWEGTDVWYELRRVRAVTSGASAPARPEGPPRTPYSSIAATGTIADSILTNRDLTGTLPFMAVNGAGTVNILTDEMNFDLTAAFIDGPTLQATPELQGLAGLSLPLVVTGTLAAPSIRPDFGALVRARAQQEVQQRVDEEQEQIQEQVDEQKQELEDRARSRVRDRLRGLFE